MLSIIKSHSLRGMDTLDVRVEVTVSRGLPQCTIIGLPDKTVQEARDRVLTAIRETGYSFKLAKIIINLSPAELKKDGGKFDLPIALGILSACGAITPQHGTDTSVMGELSLSGEVRGVRGILAMLLGAKASGARRFIIPEENRDDLCHITACELCFVSTLQEAVSCMEGRGTFEVYSPQPETDPTWDPDFSPLSIIQGQHMAKRAALIAAAGWHHILMYGPAGVGKTLLAHAIPGLVSPMQRHEILETTAIYNLFGWEEKGGWEDTHRPVREPHHSASDIAIIGGGSNPRPGEVSLAHNGILFLDEFQEFRIQVLNTLRQPLQEKRITIARASGCATFPADFMLVCAMNSCPCGNYMDQASRCICSPWQIRKFYAKIAGPVLDRIDLQIPLMKSAGDTATLSEPCDCTGWKESLLNARDRQCRRYRNQPYPWNGRVPDSVMYQHVEVTGHIGYLLSEYRKAFSPSPRAVVSLIRTARTIADLDNADNVDERHVLEAMQYRKLEEHIRLDQSLWK